ncbi:MAG: cytochrome ubiquinol oxidase subunit I [Chloroflexi bacterium]|nr:cytochrome ubiquinol oxidase subunit I [Chloroflexota bacterium]
MPVDIPYLGARTAIWIAAQQHLYLAAFVLGAPLFIVICEYLGVRLCDARYERLARETMKVVVLAYSITAAAGAAFTFILVGAYPALTSHLFTRFGPVFWLYAALILVETLLVYAYWYSWEPLARAKAAHLALGVALNVVGTAMMFLMNAVGAYMLTPPAGAAEGDLWALMANPSWSGLNLHRFVANITFGGFIVALFAAFMFLTARDEEDRAFYDWMGFTGNLIGVGTLMLLPLAGYIYAKELFLYDAQIATFMMADKLSGFFVVQGLLVGLIFLGVNYYIWLSMQRIEGGARFLRQMRITFAVMFVALAIWMMPQHFLPDLATQPPAGVPLTALVIPERAAFLGLMMAKALAVTAMILLTFLTYAAYLRAQASGAVRWGEIAPQSQYALIFLPAVVVYTMGLMGAIRELARQDWHVYRQVRDVSPYWYAPTLGYTSAVVGAGTLLFFAFLAFIFWIGFKLERPAAGEEATGQRRKARAAATGFAGAGGDGK